MKKHTFCSIALLLALTSLSIHAQSAAEVLSKYHEILGGEEKIRSLKSLHAEITVSTQNMYGSMTVKVDEDKGSFMRQKSPSGEVIVIQNKEGIWIKDPTNLEPEKQDMKDMSPPPVKVKRSLSFLQLFDYDKAGITLSLQKKRKKINKKKHYVIVATKKAKDSQRKFYFSVKDYLLYRVETIVSGELVMTEEYTDYREIDEMVIPYKNVHITPGAPKMSIKISAIRLNPEFADDVFTIEEGEYSDEE